MPILNSNITMPPETPCGTVSECEELFENDKFFESGRRDSRFVQVEIRETFEGRNFLQIGISDIHIAQCQ